MSESCPRCCHDGIGYRKRSLWGRMFNRRHPRMCMLCFHEWTPKGKSRGRLIRIEDSDNRSNAQA